MPCTCGETCESDDCGSEYHNRREETESWWTFTCEKCGCEFTITEIDKTTTTTETEVTKEGINK